MYLLPQPMKLEKEQGTFALQLHSVILIDHSVGADCLAQVRLAANFLQQEIRESLGWEVTTVRSLHEVDAGRIRLCIGETGLGEEGYLLQILGEEVTITADSGVGILYGVQTLRQIIRQQGAFLPCLKIEDAPKIGRRGLSLDVTRGRVPTLAELKRRADELCFYKMNELQLYVEHSFLFRNFSEVWRGSDPLTAEEILELDAYCKERNIDLVPSLASFGHLYEVLVTDSYGHLCELEGAGSEPFSLIDRMAHHTVDVSNEESFRMVAERIREYSELFTSGYFNICADETFDLCAGKSKALGEEKGVKRVYLDFLKRLCGVVKECGKTPMFWGDVLLEAPELLSEMPEDAILLNWEYAPEVTETKTKILTEAGVPNLYACPGVQSWNHVINRHSDAYRNISGMCRVAHKYKVRGLLVTEWGDLGHMAHPAFSTVGVIYGAAFSWNDQELTEEEINAAISAVEYGDASGRVVDYFRDLADAESIRFWNLVHYKETREKAPEAERLESVLEQEHFEAKTELFRETSRKLYELLPQVSERTRSVIAVYLLHGEGAQLLAETVKALLGKTRGGRAFGLAARLEYWLYDYKKLWRSTARESELGRLQEVIFWYADRLREL